MTNACQADLDISYSGRAFIMKKILVILNYYYPYISGVSECARIIAELYAKSGNEVTVLTSNHANLQPTEDINGVHVIRTNVLFRISKGTVSPDYIMKAIKLSRQFDVVHLHLPMMESGIIARFSRNGNLVVTYHCDVNLPKSIFNNFVVKMMDISNRICLKNARKIIITSIDYAKSSRIAGEYLHKTIECPTPIKPYHRVPVEKEPTKKWIGFCGRIVEEKGIYVLLKAFMQLQGELEHVHLKIGGDYKSIAGGSIYPEVKRFIEENKVKNVFFLGKLDESAMEEFYSSLDVMVLPSINSLEAFGMVQIEAMLCGTPVVASDLPGVRTIIQNTGMGEIARTGDAADLAQKIRMVLECPERYIKPHEEIENRYGMKHVYDTHTKAFFEGV